ncbi:unnamed protein product [Cylicostephanus goldi]|uniref:Uncharacterized protein n=1 Tax=Cylicostephanus goldi TaxID=71465 RepID=A0A3P6QUF3_CYLGO|nr:unnamed protein product [Cylicostephanus goldi]
MLRNGTPGEVAILARSSTEVTDGPGNSLDDSPRGSPTYSTESLLKHPFLNHGNGSNSNNNNNNAKTANNNAGINSIFPTIVKTENLLATMNKNNLLPAMDLTALSSNQWLSAWLANNPFAPNLGQQTLSSANAEAPSETKRSDVSEEVDYDALEIKMDEDDLHDEDINHDPSPTVRNISLDFTCKTLHVRVIVAI